MAKIEWPPMTGKPKRMTQKEIKQAQQKIIDWLVVSKRGFRSADHSKLKFKGNCSAAA